jgi:hypothetical protein
MITSSDHQVELYGGILWDCEEFVRKLSDYKAWSSIESVPKSSEESDYILLGGWKFNVRSIIDPNANVNDVLDGFHILNKHAPNMFERLFIIFFLMAINQFRNFKPSKLNSNPCHIEPEMTDLLRLCHWYYRCWELNNNNFYQFKSGEIREKLAKGLLDNIEEYKVQIKDDFNGSTEEEFIAWLKE